MVVVWRVTARCGLACPFCGYDASLDRPRADADEATVLSFGEALAGYARLSGKPVHVSWLGGEPFLWPPLARVERIFAGTYGLGLGITTNGVALAGSDMMEKLLACYDEVTVSVDGIGAAHDSLRSWPGGYALLAGRVPELARRGAARSPRLVVRVNALLTRGTVDGFGDLVDEMAAWGVSELSFNALGGIERPEYHRLHRLLPDQVERLADELPGLRKRAAARGMSLLGNAEYAGRLLSWVRGQRLPIDDCSPWENFMFIDEGGTAAPCHASLAERGVHIETLRSGDDIALLVASAGSEGSAAAKPAACADCPSTRVFGKFRREEQP